MSSARATEVLVAGGGLAGLIAAGLMERLGFETVCIDPGFARETPGGPGDLRSTALFMPAIATLERAGLWAALAPMATAIRTMRILDAGGTVLRVRERADFRAEEIGQPVFGYNLPNTALRATLLAELQTRPRLQLLPAGFVGLTPRRDALHVRLSDGSWMRTNLLIAADGRNSAVRHALDIAVRRVGYGQKALVFAVSCTEPHDGVSTEIHRSGGPFTLVPLPDRDGEPRMAVVWMEFAAEAERLATLPVADFEHALNARSCGVQGRLRLVSDRLIWPMISQLAERFDGPRTMLVAEAAHVMPPIGAQGLNTSLRDIAGLADLAAETRGAGGDIGAAEGLARFARERRCEVALRMSGIDLLNRAAQARAQPLRDLRRMGLGTLYRLPPLRKLAMRAGMNLR